MSAQRISRTVCRLNVMGHEVGRRSGRARSKLSHGFLRTNSRFWNDEVNALYSIDLIGKANWNSEPFLPSDVAVS